MLATLRRVGLAMAVLTTFLTTLPGAATAGPGDPGFSWWRFETKDLDDPAWYTTEAGPEEVTPKDGTVQGWQFAKPVNGEPPFGPSVPAFFEDVCGEASKRQPGKKRVGVVVDFGDKEPVGLPGEEKKDPEMEALPDPPARPTVKCAVVDEDATAMDVLMSAVKPMRDDAGKICAIDGYPDAKCGAAVQAGADSGNTTFYVAGGILLLLILVGGGYWMIRRRGT